MICFSIGIMKRNVCPSDVRSDMLIHRRVVAVAQVPFCQLLLSTRILSAATKNRDTRNVSFFHVSGSFCPTAVAGGVL